MSNIYPQPTAGASPTDGHHVLQAKGKDAFFRDDVSVGVCDLWAWVSASRYPKPPWLPGGDGCVTSLGTSFLGKEPLKTPKFFPAFVHSTRLSWCKFQSKMIQTTLSPTGVTLVLKP